MGITPALWIPVYTGRTRDEVDEALSSEIARTWAFNASDEFFAGHGVEHPLGAGFSGAQDILPQLLDEQTVLSAAARVPLSLMREVCLNGTPDEVVAQAAEWRDCGLRYIVVQNQSAVQRSLRRGLQSMIPFNKVVSGLKKL
jgi:phthiodiolone/phenolphthiodiolone dimycocerosates ketoreductase